MRALFTRLFILVFAVVFIGVGVFIRKQAKSQKANNTETVTGTLVEYSVEHDTDSDGRTSTAYYPVFSYTYNGTEYTERYSVGSGKKGYTQGAEVTLLIDPAFPENFAIEGDNTLMIMSWACIGGGILVLLLGLGNVNRKRVYI